MILYPAIDLKDGQCVRLEKGEMSKATVFGTDPAAQARAFADAGFEYLHVVDLNGAFAGRSENGAAVEAILAAVDLPVQLGGGIRDHAGIDAWLDKGIVRGGRVAVSGWAEATDVDVIDLAHRFEDAGVAAIVYTDIDRDGILTGLNFAATLRLAEAVSIPVIASGGLAGIRDIETLTAPRYRRLAGAIAGRALYDGRLDPAAALALIAAAREAA
jgi:phosphoribosylformimino-5-aminoimidazole carboxamide ribotide isomerase